MLSDAAKAKAYRNRQRDGLGVYKLSLNNIWIAEGLVSVGLLDPADVDDHEKRTAALLRQIQILFGPWDE